MWGIFRRWGKVTDVFISSRRNKNRWSYRFVRFWGVRDEGALKERLNNIYIKGTKMFVNRPKYGKQRAQLKHFQRGKRPIMN